MANTDVDWIEARRRLDEIFPTREHHLVWQLAHFAGTGQLFDVTFLDREPSLEVTLTQEFAFEFLAAVNYGREDRLRQLCWQIRFSGWVEYQLGRYLDAQLYAARP